MLKSTLIEDDRTPIRSGEKGVELQPISISTMTFFLDDIKFIKDKLGVVRSKYTHARAHTYIYIYISGFIGLSTNSSFSTTVLGPRISNPLLISGTQVTNQ